MVYGRIAWLSFCAVMCASGAMADGLREIPDGTLTPGVVASSDEADVCGIVEGLTYSKRHRQTPAGLKALIRKRYGIVGDGGDAEIDHRLPLSLGGEDSVYNLWWQPGNGHGVVWTYHQKDTLERLAWQRVCQKHDLALAEAQQWFMSPDWRVPYCVMTEDPERCQGSWPRCWSVPDTPGSCPLVEPPVPFVFRPVHSRGEP